MPRMNHAGQSQADAGRAAARAEFLEGAEWHHSDCPAWSPLTEPQEHRLANLAGELETTVPRALTVAQAADLIDRWQRRLQSTTTEES
ncbi:MAG TPA: hypothetical protein VNZ01_01250 [Solirubrobacteraceae bacterium]|jgi:hypothetical protein|nr:hypothetical protein [Solirubrobacteraceae bacterium]